MAKRYEAAEFGVAAGKPEAEVSIPLRFGPLSSEPAFRASPLKMRNQAGGFAIVEGESSHAVHRDCVDR